MLFPFLLTTTVATSALSTETSRSRRSLDDVIWENEEDLNSNFLDHFEKVRFNHKDEKDKSKESGFTLKIGDYWLNFWLKNDKERIPKTHVKFRGWILTKVWGNRGKARDYEITLYSKPQTKECWITYKGSSKFEWWDENDRTKTKHIFRNSKLNREDFITTYYGECDSAHTKGMDIIKEDNDE